MQQHERAAPTNEWRRGGGAGEPGSLGWGGRELEPAAGTELEHRRTIEGGTKEQAVNAVGMCVCVWPGGWVAVLGL